MHNVRQSASAPVKVLRTSRTICDFSFGPLVSSPFTGASARRPPQAPAARRAARGPKWHESLAVKIETAAP
ncbi:hypothetical protein EVAR_75283_1 [Eumeta japonica]|uniref:Uncharacterized protein n=1 Tax=Eumeta variegata TaxID=151549 RepID=A0A4C1YTU1_EUMVA|nr:hypothetical protein EVAR_75283_1 [Eumeta japonica]